MKNYNIDDEIIIGRSYYRRKRRKRILFSIFGALVVIGIGVASWMFFGHTDETDDVEASEISAQEVKETGANIVRDKRIAEVTDSINDVVFSYYPIDSLKASIEIGIPDTTDMKIFLLTAAADFRGDGKGIVGDFILDKEQLATGSRKEGWCYVSPEGTLTIGVGAAENMKEAALKNGGCFFRQFPLVMDGEICPPTILKGKAQRRAIGFKDGRPTIVKSHHEESVYDFAQALADYGFSHALYLPGGTGRWLCNTTEGRIYTCEFPAIDEYVNYLIFR